MRELPCVKDGVVLIAARALHHLKEDMTKMFPNGDITVRNRDGQIKVRGRVISDYYVRTYSDSPIVELIKRTA